MALELIIVRHGQSEGNRDRRFTGHGPSPLTARGHEEARAVATRIAAQPIDLLLSSDLPRAVQTAEPIAELTGVPIVQDRDIREKNFGDLTGMSFSELEAKHPDVWRGLLARDPRFQPPGGESHAQCRERMDAFFVKLFADRPNGRVVIVSHGVAINHMLYSLMRTPIDLPPAMVFQIDNCSIQRAERQTEGFVRIVHINERSHLVHLTP